MKQLIIEVGRTGNGAWVKMMGRFLSLFLLTGAICSQGQGVVPTPISWFSVPIVNSGTPGSNCSVVTLGPWTNTNNSGLIRAITLSPPLFYTIPSDPFIVPMPLSPIIIDSVRPIISITNLVPNQRISNENFIVKGRVSDNYGVSHVWCRLNGAPAWQAVDLTNRWSIPVQLSPGTNKFEIYAVDFAGNRSRTNSVTFSYVQGAEIVLLTNGTGRISRDFKGKVLEVGRVYTVTAIPGTGQVFSNWTGTISPVTSRTMKFTMQTNMVLQANFVSDPFPALQGSYYGLFYPTNAPATSSNVGAINLTLSKSGIGSGKIQCAGASYTLARVVFDLEGKAQFFIPRKYAAPLQVSLSLNWAEKQILGTVSTPDWVAEVNAVRAAGDPLCRGPFTLLVEGSSETNAPPGTGVASVVVDKFGSAQITGTLADGSVLNMGSGVPWDRIMPIYISLYKGKGVLFGWLCCGNWATVQWIKPAAPADRYYTNGFCLRPNVVVAKYYAPRPGKSPLGWTEGSVAFTGGNLNETIRSQVVWADNQLKALGGSITNLTFNWNPANGLFTGSFRHPNTAKVIPFRGAVQMDPLRGTYAIFSGGWFLGSNNGGSVYLAEQFQSPPHEGGEGGSVITGVSSTTIGGYVDSTAQWHFW